MTRLTKCLPHKPKVLSLHPQDSFTCLMLQPVSVAPGFVDGQIPEAPQRLCIARSLNSVFSDRCCVKNKMEISVSTYPQYTYLYMYPLCKYAFTYLNMIIHYTQEKTLRFTRTHYSVCVSHTHAHIHAHILTYNHKYTHSHSHTFTHTHTHRQ